MRILLVHNFYQQPGGEDQVFAAEEQLLLSHGHQVFRYIAHNDEINGMGRLALAGRTVWNRRTAAELKTLAQSERIEIVHFHNTFPLISPSAYLAARRAGCAVVQTIHNFRLLCPNGLLFRNGRQCEACLGRALAWPAILHGCYRDNRAATAVVAGSTAIHHALGTYRNLVDIFIAVSEFSRSKLVEGGLPAQSIVVKPNFVASDSGLGDGKGGYALFVGRLSPEKGIEPLVEAWRNLGKTPTLVIAGDGPLAPIVSAAAKASDSIRWLGRVSRAEVNRLMGDAAFLVLPSVCYEGMPIAALEAFAKGTPVLASDLGAMVSLVEDGRTGLRFRPGDSQDLAAKVVRLINEPATLAQMRIEARREFEAKYTAERNYEQLLTVYRHALERAEHRFARTT